jgi:threonine dehydratase
MSQLPTLPQIESAAAVVYQSMPATPQYAWPLLAQRLGTQVWLKHENHTPTGAFKVRGGLVYLEGLARRQPDCPGIISATRGNHGQSLAFAARRYRIPTTIVVPNSSNTAATSRKPANMLRRLPCSAIFIACRRFISIW